MAQVELDMAPLQRMTFGPTSAEGQPCSLWERKVPPLVQLMNYTSQCYEEREYELSAVTDAILHRWLALRPGLMQRLAPPQVVPYPWFDANNEPIVNMHTVGGWYFFKLKHWLPAPPEGVRVGSRTFKDEPLTEVIHSASMYTAWCSIIHGLKPGENPGKRGMTGVYCYRNRKRQAAISSSMCGVYSDLANNGIFFSPRYQLFFSETMHMDACQAWSAGNGQIALKEHMFYLAGLYIHALTRQELLRHSAKLQLWFNCDQWQPGMEHLPCFREPAPDANFSSSSALRQPRQRS